MDLRKTPALCAHQVSLFATCHPGTWTRAYLQIQIQLHKQLFVLLRVWLFGCLFVCGNKLQTLRGLRSRAAGSRCFRVRRIDCSGLRAVKGPSRCRPRCPGSGLAGDRGGTQVECPDHPGRAESEGRWKTSRHHSVAWQPGRHELRAQVPVIHVEVNQLQSYGCVLGASFSEAGPGADELVGSHACGGSQTEYVDRYVEVPVQKHQPVPRLLLDLPLQPMRVQMAPRRLPGPHLLPGRLQLAPCLLLAPPCCRFKCNWLHARLWPARAFHTHLQPAWLDPRLLPGPHCSGLECSRFHACCQTRWRLVRVRLIPRSLKSLLAAGSIAAGSSEAGSTLAAKSLLASAGAIAAGPALAAGSSAAADASADVSMRVAGSLLAVGPIADGSTHAVGASLLQVRAQLVPRSTVVCIGGPRPSVRGPPMPWSVQQAVS